MDIDLRYLSQETDRHGNGQLYVRRYGRRVRLRVDRNDPSFIEAYQRALETLGELSGAIASSSNKSAKKIAVRGTLGWLAALYFGSEEFMGLQSGPTRRAVIEDCLREPVRDGSKDLMADCPLSFITPAKIKRLRDLKKGLPGAANNRRKYLSAMLGWAVEDGHLKANPARDVRRVRYATDGFHTWTVAEVCQFAARHPIGTRPYLAMCLLLFTGMRAGDMIELGPQHLRGDWLAFVPRKTRHVRADVSEKPLLAPLAAAIAAGPVGQVTFLETQYGQRFSDKGIGNAMRGWCDPGPPVRLHSPRPPQGRREHRGRAWRDHASAYGDLRLVDTRTSGAVHPGRQSQTDGERCHAFLDRIQPRNGRITNLS